MSSKTRERLSMVVDRNKTISQENQKLKRFLVACMYEFGQLNVSYQSAVRVQDEDQLEVDFDRKTGLYSCKLVGSENAERMGSGSETTLVHRGEGNVGGSLHEEGELPETAIEAVQPEYEQRESEDRPLLDSEEVKRGSE